MEPPEDITGIKARYGSGWGHKPRQVATPEQVASMIASIVHATRYANPVWETMTDEEQNGIMAEWAALIRHDPERAADQIFDSILEHPRLGDAWRRLSEISESSLRPNSIKHLVSLADVPQSSDR